MAKEKVKKQYLNGYERILKIDYMISHMHYPSVEDFARETEASIPTINRDLRDLRMKFGAEDILQYDRYEKGFYYRYYWARWVVSCGTFAFKRI